MDVKMTLPDRQPRVTKAVPPPPPEMGRCHYYISKKNRYCKMVPAKEQRFCGEHIMNESESTLPPKKIRIPCPIDSTHTCYQTQLQKHLKICNSRLDDQPAGFSRNVNAGPADLDFPVKLSINDLAPHQLRDFIAKVEGVSNEFCLDDVDVDLKDHPAMKEELSRTDLSEDGALKHARQQASILGHMSSTGLLRDDFCFVEMGAGRGHVNHWIQRALGDETPAKFLLVDRQGVRYKMDAFHRENGRGPEFHRLRMDIEHLELSSVPEVASCGFPVVVVSKHLCGAATDLALRCSFPERRENSTSESGEASTIADGDAETTNGSGLTLSRAATVAGVVVALCCHHRVEYRSYVGHDFLTSLGFEPREFWLLRSLSSWATCGFDRPRKENGIGEEEEKKKKDNDEGVTGSSDASSPDVVKNDAHSGGTTDEMIGEKPFPETSRNDFKEEWGWYYELTAEDRSRIGRRCKRILDQGRVEFLLKRTDPRYDVRLVPYVEKSTSLENILLLAVLKK